MLASFTVGKGKRCDQVEKRSIKVTRSPSEIPERMGCVPGLWVLTFGVGLDLGAETLPYLLS